MDITALSNYIVPLVFVAALCVGYAIKHASFLKFIPNDDIPVILGVGGAILNIFVSGLSIESVVAGAVTGLASTGFHQMFKRWIENTKSE